MVVKGALRRVVIVYLAAKLTVEVWPTFEGIALTINAWRRTRSDQRSLYEEGARPTEGIHQIALSVPARLEQDARCQHLINRSTILLHTIAPLVQALARRV